MKTIELNKDIYDLEAIRSTIDSFSEVGEFSIKDIGKSWIVSMSGESEGLVKDEFLNYCLGLTISSKNNF